MPINSSQYTSSMIIDRNALAKQGDNALCTSVRVFVCLLELSCLNHMIFDLHHVHYLHVWSGELPV